jgi:hypothetical protein
LHRFAHHIYTHAPGVLIAYSVSLP